MYQSFESLAEKRIENKRKDIAHRAKLFASTEMQRITTDNLLKIYSPCFLLEFRPSWEQLAIGGVRVL
jgi:hypothetical protein